MARVKAKTVAQYKILQWVDENFFVGSVEIEFSNENTAVLIDSNRDELVVSYVDGDGIIIED